MTSGLSTRDPHRTATAALRDGMVKVAGFVASPLVPADYLDLISPLSSSRNLRGRIVAITPEAGDAVTLVIRPGRGWRRHVPGQYVRIGVDVDGVRQWRAYSLTSPAAGAGGCFTITVKAIPAGKVSNHLVRRCRAGTVVQLEQPSGEFTLTDVRADKVLFVTAGSGITPVMGMLRGATDHLTDVVVVHSAPTADEVIFGPELRQLAADGRIKFIEWHSAISGRLDVAELGRLVGDLADRETWACGPAGLLDELERHFARHHLPERLHTERFRAPLRATGEGGEGGEVTFARSGKVRNADGATALLDVGESAGVLMPSGCRMGICFGCVVALRDGAVRDLRSGDITAGAPGDGVLVQTCVSAAAGACDIDI